MLGCDIGVEGMRMNSRRRTRRGRPLGLEGALWLSAGGESLGGRGRIALLQAIAEHGSITQGALWGILSWIVVKASCGKFRQISGVILALGIACVFLLVFSEHFRH